MEDITTSRLFGSTQVCDKFFNPFQISKLLSQQKSRIALTSEVGKQLGAKMIIEPFFLLKVLAKSMVKFQIKSGYFSVCFCLF